jgi:hypothetical protein
VIGSGTISKASARFNESFIVTFQASDNAGIYLCGLISFSPNNIANEPGSNYCTIVSGTNTNGTFSSPISIPSTTNLGSNGGVVNMPTGTYQIKAGVQDVGQTVPTSQASFYVLIGTIQITG